jgi:hypothetical protein
VIRTRTACHRGATQPRTPVPDRPGTSNPDQRRPGSTSSVRAPAPIRCPTTPRRGASILTAGLFHITCGRAPGPRREDGPGGRPAHPDEHPVINQRRVTTAPPHRPPGRLSRSDHQTCRRSHGRQPGRRPAHHRRRHDDLLHRRGRPAATSPSSSASAVARRRPTIRYLTVAAPGDPARSVDSEQRARFPVPQRATFALPTPAYDQVERR